MLEERSNGIRPRVEADLSRREQRSLAALAWAWPTQAPPPSITTPHSGGACNHVATLGRASNVGERRSG